MQRRDFLKGVASSSMAASFAEFAAISQGAQAPWALGLELISVLTPLGVELSRTLQKVAAIGYTEVETLGSLGRRPAELHEVLARCHLRSPAQHLVPDDLYEVYQSWDRGGLTLPQALARLQDGYALGNLEHIIEQGIARARQLQQHFLVWPVLFDDQVASRSELQKVVQAFNRAGELCQKSGMTFAFHNGSNAARRVDGTAAYDLLLSETDPATVKMELDTYYLTRSGASARDYLEKHPKRYPLMHLKDFNERGDIVDLGQGSIDFAALLKAAHRAGVQHFFVEHDRAVDPFASARVSFDYVRHL
jgi:sugar phosphate isomerase/epimerase